MPRVDQGKITSFQGSLLVLGTISQWIALFVPSLMIAVAGRDAWLTAIPATLFGVVVALLAVSLGSRFPGETLVGLIPKVLGRGPGLFVNAAYVFWLIFLGALALRGLSDLIMAFVLPRTPILVVIGSFLLVCAVAVRGGIEVIARLTQVTVPVGIGLVFLGWAFSVPIIRTENWFPLLENGVLPIWQGTYIAAPFFGEVIIGLLVILPYLNQPRHALRTLVTPVIALGGVMMAASLLYVGVLNAEVAGRVLFPALAVASLVSVAEFIQNIEAVMITIWMLAHFAKLTMWYYASVTAIAEMIGLDEYRPLAWPVGLLIGAFSLLFFPNVSEFFDFIRFSAPPFMLLFELIIPLLLLGVAYVRSNGERGAHRSIERGSPSKPNVPANDGGSSRPRG